MIRKIEKPTIIESAGNKPKRIEEYVGVVNTGTKDASIAKMTSPQGWVEPGQKPEFDEYTVVLKGALTIKTIDQEITVKAGEGIIVEKNEWVQYSTPDEGGAEYMAVCLPAFTMDAVHRDSN